jgi:hypothetical protein
VKARRVAGKGLLSAGPGWLRRWVDWRGSREGPAPRGARCAVCKRDVSREVESAQRGALRAVTCVQTVVRRRLGGCGHGRMWVASAALLCTGGCIAWGIASSSGRRLRQRVQLGPRFCRCYIWYYSMDGDRRGLQRRRPFSRVVWGRLSGPFRWLGVSLTRGGRDFMIRARAGPGLVGMRVLRAPTRHCSHITHSRRLVCYGCDAAAAAAAAAGSRCLWGRRTGASPGARCPKGRRLDAEAVLRLPLPGLEPCLQIIWLVFFTAHHWII